MTRFENSVLPWFVLPRSLPSRAPPGQVARDEVAKPGEISTVEPR